MLALLTLLVTLKQLYQKAFKRGIARGDIRVFRCLHLNKLAAPLKER